MMRSFVAGVLMALGFALTGSAQAQASLPDYRPAQKVAGVLRVSGNDQMAELMQRWSQGFQRIHPSVRIETWLKGSGSGMYGLEMRTADIALMGRPIHPYERYGVYERAWVYPVEVEVATGSFDRPHKSPAYAIFVHKSNPLAKMTLQQLDAVFGAERGGGWKALTWDETAARKKEQTIRTWGRLGLTGEWADKAIHPYGPPNLGAGAITAFQAMVMGGGAIFNEDLREYADRQQMIKELEKDPQGIAYAALAERSDGVKTLALAASAAGPYVELSRKSATDRSYPLARPVYVYYTIDNDQTEIASPRVKPIVNEFLRYVLSKEGQRAVEQEGSYLPIGAALANAQLRKIASPEIPPERKLLKDED
jgi:phosphate transport system substrate-binding protein